MPTSTTLPILDGLVKLGVIKGHALETLKNMTGVEHDKLTLFFHSGYEITIYTYGNSSTTSTYISVDNASTP